MGKNEEAKVALGRAIEREGGSISWQSDPQGDRAVSFQILPSVFLASLEPTHSGD